MRRALRFIFRGSIGVVALVGVLGALLGYYGYSPAPELPRLSGTLTRGTMTVGGLTRTYRTYVPRGHVIDTWRHVHRSHRGIC
jgi:polyhydroxybutyrate depolymerase